MWSGHCVSWIFKLHLKIHPYGLGRIVVQQDGAKSAQCPQFSKCTEINVFRACGLFERWCGTTSAITRFENIWIISVKLSKRKSFKKLPSRVTRTKRLDYLWSETILCHIIIMELLKSFKNVFNRILQCWRPPSWGQYFLSKMNIKRYELISSNMNSTFLYIFPSSKLRSPFYSITKSPETAKYLCYYDKNWVETLLTDFTTILSIVSRGQLELFTAKRWPWGLVNKFAKKHSWRCTSN